MKLVNQAVFKKPEKLICKIEVSPFDMSESDDAFIKEKAVFELAKEIISNNFATITKETKMDPYANDVYKIMIHLVPPDMTHISMWENCIEIEGIKFNSEKVEKAIKKSYPEYFI